jgi:hypothetical protein
MLVFLNWQLDAISLTDPSVLRTVGTWSEFTGSDAFGKRTFWLRVFAQYNNLIFEILGNYYTDECLTRMGGRSGGTVSFYQMHTYSYNGAFNPTTPFKVSKIDYCYVYK